MSTLCETQTTFWDLPDDMVFELAKTSLRTMFTLMELCQRYYRCLRNFTYLSYLMKLHGGCEDLPVVADDMLMMTNPTVLWKGTWRQPQHSPALRRYGCHHVAVVGRALKFRFVWHWGWYIPACVGVETKIGFRLNETMIDYCIGKGWYYDKTYRVPRKKEYVNRFLPWKIG